MSVLMRIWREGLETKVLGLNLQDNTLCVYRGEQRIVKEVKDLVEAIEQNLFQRGKGVIGQTEK
jgi:hypothetical protein